MNIHEREGLLDETGTSPASVAFCVSLVLPRKHDAIASPEHFVRVASSLLVRGSVALRLQKGVWPPVEHHGGGRHGDDSHPVTNPGLQGVVPLIV